MRASPLLRATFASLAIGVVCWACPPFPEGGQYHCSSSADCEPGLSCHPAGFCIECRPEPCTERARRCGPNGGTTTSTAPCCDGPPCTTPG